MNDVRAVIDARLAACGADPVARLAVQIDAGRRLARDLLPVDVFVGLNLMSELDDAAAALAAAGIEDPAVELPAMLGDQARAELPAVLEPIAAAVFAGSLPPDVYRIAVPAATAAAEACLHLTDLTP